MLERRDLGRNIESEKPPVPIITAYVIRHGESVKDKSDPGRGLTDKGLEEARDAGRKIAEEIAQETPPGVEIELRGFDSGMPRANRTIVEVLKVLTMGKGLSVTIASATAESAYDASALEEMKRSGKLRIVDEARHVIPPSHAALRPVEIPGDARTVMKAKAKEMGEGADLMTILLTTPPSDLKAMGVETLDKAYERMKSAEEATSDLAVFLKDREQKEKPKRIVYVAISHGYVMASYLARELKIHKPFNEEHIPNCEGFRIDFPGERKKKPIITLWGPGIEKDLGALSHVGRP